MKMFKRFTAIVLVVITLLAAMPMAFASDYILPDESEIIGATMAGDMGPMAEETVNYYKTVDGIVYYRVWSLTRGIWLTDWIRVPGQ